MRVRGTGLRRLHRDQHGAVLMIVAVSLVVLFGLLILTVDLGRVVASRRDFVRASDAAAIAAAQQCADANGEAAALAAADQTAQANEAAAMQAIWEIDSAECSIDVFPPGLAELPSVRVGYEREIDFLFAPVFGFTSGTVQEEATAVWGPAATPAVAPIMMDFAALTDCTIPQPFPPGSTPISCEFEYPPPQVDNPDWGELVLERWGEEFAADVGGSYCRVDANILRDSITEGGVLIDPPPPTWDCIDNGLTFSVWMAMEGLYLTFPVVDLEQSTGKIGNADCTGADAGCIIDTVYVISYVCLDVIDARNQGSTIILTTEWRGACAAPGPPEPDILDLGVHGVRLVD